MGRRALILLALSVALNLFFVGLVAGRYWQRHDGVDERQRHAPGAFARGHGPSRGRHGGPLRWLSEDERARLRPVRQALREQRARAEEQLRAEHFDAAEFRAALEKVRRETDAVEVMIHDSLARRAEGASVEQRRELADAVYTWSRRRRSSSSAAGESGLH